MVLFPYWFVEQRCRRKAQDPWVLETKAFLKFLAYEDPQLESSDVSLIALHLDRYIRSAQSRD